MCEQLVDSLLQLVGILLEDNAGSTLYLLEVLFYRLPSLSQIRRQMAALEGTHLFELVQRLLTHPKDQILDLCGCFFIRYGRSNNTGQIQQISDVYRSLVACG